MTMTREEAIKELYAWLDGCCGDEEIEPAREAFKMAIEALRAQDVTDTNVGDMVYRQAAIDALDEIRHALWEIDIPSPTVPEYVEHHEQVQSVWKLLDKKQKELYVLPSVQPEQDREFLKLTVRNSNGRPYYSIIYLELDDNGVGHDFEGYSSYSLDVISDYLKKYFMPSAQPVIRCRDCISYQEGIDIDGKPFTRCNGSVRTYGHTLPDWYCADAERRTDD